MTGTSSRIAVLEQRLVALASTAPSAAETLRGSVGHRHVRCGRRGCHCLNGQGHGVSYLSLSVGGHTRQISLTPETAEIAQRLVANHRRLQESIEEASLLHVELLGLRRQLQHEERRAREADRVPSHVEDVPTTARAHEKVPAAGMESGPDTAAAVDAPLVPTDGPESAAPNDSAVPNGLDLTSEEWMAVRARLRKRRAEEFAARLPERQALVAACLAALVVAGDSEP